MNKKKITWSVEAEDLLGDSSTCRIPSPLSVNVVSVDGLRTDVEPVSIRGTWSYVTCKGRDQCDRSININLINAEYTRVAQMVNSADPWAYPNSHHVIFHGRRKPYPCDLQKLFERLVNLALTNANDLSQINRWDVFVSSFQNDRSP